MSRVKPERMWAVVGDNFIFGFSVSGRRKDAIATFIENTDKPWKWWRKHYGYTVRRVIVTLDPTETESVNNNASGVEDETASAATRC